MDIEKYSEILYKKARELSLQVRIVMSNKPIDKSFVKPQDNKYPKPDGLWYSFGGSWLAFGSKEVPDMIEGYKFIYMIEVDESKLIKVSSDNLVDFWKKYKLESYKYDDAGRIDWIKVAKDYSGFENPPPYSTGEYYWWNTLDVPGGCIWDGSCIKNLIRLGEKVSDEDWYLTGREEEPKISQDLVDEIDTVEFNQNELYTHNNAKNYG